VRALAGLREVTVDGRVTVPEVRSPSGKWPLGAVGDALVFETNSGGLEVWDPRTGSVTRRLPGAVMGTAQGSLLASCDAAYETLQIVDVNTGEARVIAPPSGFDSFLCWSGAFSPNGTLLALPATAGSDLETPRTLVLVDAEQGTATAVEGSRVAPGYVHVAWAASGQSVFMGGGERYERQIVEYRLGDGRAVTLSVDVADFYGMAAS
jgi:hypothetical protein